MKFWNCTRLFSIMMLFSASAAFVNVADAADESSITVSAQELLKKIIASEEKIHDVQADYVFFEPETNKPFWYGQWGYAKGKEFLAVIRFMPVGNGVGYRISQRMKRSFDGDKQWWFCKEADSDFSECTISPPAPDEFKPYPTPSTLSGFDDIRYTGRQTFGEVLQEAKRLSVKDELEEMDGHACAVMEAIGIVVNSENTRDVRAWIDMKRGFRPLRIDIYHRRVGEDRFKKIVCRIYDLKLRKINGIWFPIEGKRDTFSTKVLPPDGMTREEALARFTKEELKQKCVRVQVPRSPARKVLVDVGSIRINEGIRQERFRVKPPVGCQVWDDFTKNRYVVADNEVTQGDEEPASDIKLSRLKLFAPAGLMKGISPETLVGTALSELKEWGVLFGNRQTTDKMMLIFILDINQRPSRECIRQLGKQAEQLKEKGVVVACVQASNVEQKTLDDWVKKYEIPFPVGMIESDEEKTRFAWGVKSLPWLILTDKKHVVRTEGFGLSELDDKVEQIDNKERAAH